MEIGPNNYIGHNVWIGGRGSASVGEWFLCGPNVVIISSNHDFRDRTQPYAEQEEVPGEVKIGANVWLGAGCVVLPGAIIGDHAVIAAGSVVRGVIGSRTLAAGVPAVEVRTLRCGERWLERSERSKTFHLTSMAGITCVRHLRRRMRLSCQRREMPPRASAGEDGDRVSRAVGTVVSAPWSASKTEMTIW